MPKHIYIKLDTSERHFDNQLSIKDQWGMPHKVDGFSVLKFCGETSVEIMLFHLNGKRINVTRKTKRLKFAGGELQITINNKKYKVGTFKEELQ